MLEGNIRSTLVVTPIRACAGLGKGAIKGVHHVGLLCEDLQRSLHFYVDVLGMSPSPRSSCVRCNSANHRERTASRLEVVMSPLLWNPSTHWQSWFRCRVCVATQQPPR